MAHLNPQSILDEQIGGHQAWDHSTANVYRDQCPGPLQNNRHDITHPVVVDLLSGQNSLFGQLRHRNIKIAANQRSNEQENCDAWTYTEARIGITQRLDLKEDQQNNEYADKDRKGWRRKRKVI